MATRRSELAAAGLVTLCLASPGCTGPIPRIAAEFERVSPKQHRVRFVLCKPYGDLIDSISVYDLAARRRVCALKFRYDLKQEMLSTASVWIYGTPVEGYRLEGECPPLTPGHEYGVTVEHMSVAGLENTRFRVRSDGSIEHPAPVCEQVRRAGD
jgi:hypothetical protein